MGAVLRPFAAGLDELAGRDLRRVADDRHRLAPTAGTDPQHAETAVLVVEHHPLDLPGQHLDRLTRLGLLRHPSMMTTGEPRRQPTRTADRQ